MKFRYPLLTLLSALILVASAFRTDEKSTAGADRQAPAPQYEADTLVAGRGHLDAAPPA